MNDHHEELRVAPDPSLAEELRRHLHARIVSGGRDVWAAETDADDREGELLMLTTDDRPSGNEPSNRRRTAPSRRLLLVGAAAAAILAAGVVLADEDDEQVDTATSTPTTPARDILEVDPDSAIEPGHYFIDPDGDPSTPLVVFYEVAAVGWSPWQGAVKYNATAHTAINITTVDNLVVDGCRDHSPADPPIGQSVEDLADALAALEPFEVTSAPREVTAFGYEGIHLQLTVPDAEARLGYTNCLSGILVSWINDHYLGGAFSGYATEQGRTEDFWILDVEGERLVIETNEGPSSSTADIAERDAIFDSIRIQP